MSFPLPRPQASQAPLRPSAAHSTVHTAALNSYLMDDELMNGGCSGTYDNTTSQFFSVKVSSLAILARFNQIL